MRVLLTNTGPWGTGSGTVAEGVLQEIKKKQIPVKALFPDSGFSGQGYEHYYSSPDLYKIVPFPATYGGVNLYTFPLIIPDPNPRNYNNAWTFKKLNSAELRAYFGYLKEELKKVLDVFKPDVVECQHIWAIDYILHELGYDYICTAHHSDQMGFIYDERMQEYARESAWKASYIFAISDFVNKEVQDLYKVEPEKVITIPNGYDQNKFYAYEANRESILNKHGIENKNTMPIITFCGKVSRTKGLDILLKANKILQKEIKALLIIMGSGELDNFSDKELEGTSLENVFFLGHRSPQELADFHNISTLSVLPSRSEGFGIAALEAMGCGLPLVVTNVGGLASFAVGQVVPKENPQALAEAILSILEMPEDSYLSLSEEASKVAQKYSWKSMVEIRMPYYQEVAFLNQKRRQGF